MKRLLIWSATFFLTLTCGISRAEYVSEEPQKITIDLKDADDNSDRLKHTLEIYPKELLLGDVVYLASYDENTSNETLKDYPDLGAFSVEEHFVRRVKLSSSQLTNEYVWSPEGAERNHYEEFPERDLPPGEKRLSQAGAFEFPPLEDWEAPFWRELKEKLTPEGIVCQLQITCCFYVQENEDRDNEYRTKTVTLNIVVKPRPEKETRVLDKWRNYTPEKMFPLMEYVGKLDGIMCGKKYVQPFHLTEEDMESFLLIDGQKYDPRHFIRTGFRKPSIPNNPTTLEGWRNLDVKMCESTMRDEVRLTRMLLEYYSADETKTEQTKKELIDWLTSLPDPQRVVFLDFIVKEGVVYFYQTPFADKSLALLRGVFNLLPEPLNTRARNFEKRAPTLEELAGEGKNLPESFRLWTYNGPIGKETIVAKLIRTVGESEVRMEFRDGSADNLRFDCFSDRDKEYIRNASGAAQ